MANNKKTIEFLPYVHQTTVLKNFFENTVEVMFSKAQVETIEGFIGSPTYAGLKAGAYIPELTATKQAYSLIPVVNTINSETGRPENVTFYDEFIDVLGTYGVDTSDHNKLFNEEYYSFMPPIDSDKLLNYQEYYWYPEGPDAIFIEGTADNPIDVTMDVSGQSCFVAPDGTILRNGMKVVFRGVYIIPQSFVGIEYIVEGVGDSIVLVPWNKNYVTKFSTPVENPYDGTVINYDPNNPDIVHTAGIVESLWVRNTGVGYTSGTTLDITVMGRVPGETYVNPFTNQNDVWYSEVTPASISPVFDTNGGISNVTVHSGGDHYSQLVGVSVNDPGVSQGINVAQTILLNLPICINLNGGLASTVDFLTDESGGSADNTGITLLYTYDGGPALVEYCETLEGGTEDLVPSIEVKYLYLNDVSEVYVGQYITSQIGSTTWISGIVAEVEGNIITLEDSIVYPILELEAAGETIPATFTGRGFIATVNLDWEAVSGDANTINSPNMVRAGFDPNSEHRNRIFYLLGGEWAYDRPSDGPGDTGGVWDTGLTQGVRDYMLQQRGARNDNVWSRVNFWFHRNNFLDAGQSLPGREYRAERPIIEFKRNIEMYNMGESSLGAVNIASTEKTLAEVNGGSGGTTVDGVPVVGATVIFPTEKPEISKYVYVGTQYDNETIVTVSGTNTSEAYLKVKIAGEPGEGIVDDIVIIEPGSGYTPATTVVTISGGDPTVNATAEAVIHKKITDFTVANSGVNYSNKTTEVFISAAASADVISEASATATIGNATISEVALISGGAGYVAPVVEVLTTTGSGANITATVSNGEIVNLTIVDGGTGYAATDTVIITETDPVAEPNVIPAYALLDEVLGEIIDVNIDIIGSIPQNGEYTWDASLTVTINGVGSGASVTEVVETFIGDVTMTNKGAGYTLYGGVVMVRAGDPVLNPNGAQDGDAGFIPLEVQQGEMVQIMNGNENLGREFIFDEDIGWSIAQEKFTANQAPLFNLYDDEGVYLGNQVKYPLSNFLGNKLFSYAVAEDVAELPATSAVVSSTSDDELGFPLVYRPFQSSSEILFTNHMETQTYTYAPLASTTSYDILGYNYYRALGDTPEFAPYWKTASFRDRQRIVTKYIINQLHVDRAQTEFYIGGIPAFCSYRHCGYNINVHVNGVKRTDFEYRESNAGFIFFYSFDFSVGDLIEIDIYAPNGLISTQSVSKFETPLSWGHNPFNENIQFISEPEYLEHFRVYQKDQKGFVGDPLGNNNFPNTAQESRFATEIVQTNQDPMLATFLMDDLPHNVVDALRFNASEYTKYKNRLRKEINKYYQENDVDVNDIEGNLEYILRNLISFRVGRNVFNRTYMVPFGDNYQEYSLIINSANTTELPTGITEDLSLIENSLLVYAIANNGDGVKTLLTVDQDYTVTSETPITVQLLGDYTGYKIVCKVYNSERDSAQCPSTPSALGMFPLFAPGFINDDSFRDPIEMLIGHDGSRTPVYGDPRDLLMLEFEKRIYNGTKKEFRDQNSVADLSVFNTRPGAFRDTGFDYTEWYNLMRYHFATWNTLNKTDPVVNEFWNNADPWSWNYRGQSDLPGHWRGFYEYYYDTVHPNTHPWEMLGFTEEPLWWIDEYGSDYSSANEYMWGDLEEGIIRRGPRENLSDLSYQRTDNPYRRPYLYRVLPVDADANLIPPANIADTGSTDITVTYVNELVDNSLGYKVSSFEQTDGLNIKYDSEFRYISSAGILNYSVTDVETDLLRIEPRPAQYKIPNNPLFGACADFAPRTRPSQCSNNIPGTKLSTPFIGVLANGMPLNNINDAGMPSYNNDDVWHYNVVFGDRFSLTNPGVIKDDGSYEYYLIPPAVVGETEFADTVHSPIIGWALDGLPIYGPYGYTKYNASGQVVDGTITNIKSPYVLRPGNRAVAPGGAHTGLFVEDYMLDAAKEGPGSGAYTSRWNTRYGVTPDSPNTPITFYVATQDDLGNPMFPYHVGGNTQSHTGSNTVWAGEFFGIVYDLRGIESIKITDCGQGYGPAPTALVTGDGRNATVEFTKADGAVRNIVINNPGTGYDWETTTAVIIGDGEGATCRPVVIDGKIVEFEMLTFGSGYSFATVEVIQVADPITGEVPGVDIDAVIPTVVQDPLNGIVDDAIVSATIVNPGTEYTYADLDVNTDGTVPGALIQYTITLDNVTDNSIGAGTYLTDADTALTSTKTTYITQLNDTAQSWQFSDGAPVENAWKYSEVYPFAVAEGLLLARSARFATLFADPTALTVAGVDRDQLLSKRTHERWRFWDENEFCVHGDRDADNNFITNIGYTQWINSWLEFQGLNITTEFVTPMRTLNMRLGHRFSGFVDKDTMTVRTDQFNTAGTTGSLIIQDSDHDIQVHSSQYKTRNHYTGVMIELVGVARYNEWQPNTQYYIDDTVKYGDKYYTATADHLSDKLFSQDFYVDWTPNRKYLAGETVYVASEYKYYRCLTTHTAKNEFQTEMYVDGVMTQVWDLLGGDIEDAKWTYNPRVTDKKIGYKVRGYDRTQGVFRTLVPDMSGGVRALKIGGDPAPYTEWEPQTTYLKNTIVLYQGRYYQNKVKQTSGAAFDYTLWTSLPSLPNIGGAEAIVYKKYTTQVKTINYETVYTDIQSVVDLLMGLGAYQQNLGFDFGDFVVDIGDVSNWEHAAKQFLFWTTSKWEIGNTLNLSPMSNRVTYETRIGFVSEMDRIDREQFTLLDQNGGAIEPQDCSILRTGNRVTVEPPAGKQIYGALMFTKEIDHVLTLKNTTEFGDVIYDPVLSQKHKRLKVKGKRTVDWDGTLGGDGFVILDDELKPNLDNLAQTMGRYNEAGFIPVEEQVYEASRANYGFQRRDYLTNLDILDEQQFDFYRGMIQAKGTKSSLEKIAKSSAVLDGNIDVYDEWAIKVGDFGDVNARQSIELLIDKANLVQDPQLITLSFPEDTTGIVERVDVLYRRNTYSKAPEIRISAPLTASGKVNPDGRVAKATATLRSDGKLDKITVTDKGRGYEQGAIGTVIASDIGVDTDDYKFNTAFATSGPYDDVANSWISTDVDGVMYIVNNITAENVAITFDNVSGAQNIEYRINEYTANTGVSATVFVSHVPANLQPGESGNDHVQYYTLQLSGSDFTLYQDSSNIVTDQLILPVDQRFQPQQRYVVQDADTTTTANIMVMVDSVVVPNEVNGNVNWTYHTGDTWVTGLGGTSIALGANNTSATITLGVGQDHNSANLTASATTIVDGVYPYAELYIDGVLISDVEYKYHSAPIFDSVYEQTFTIDTLSTIIIPDASLLPGNLVKWVDGVATVDPDRTYTVKELATVKFEDYYQGDLPGKTLRIDITTNDGIAVKLGRERTYAIDEDVADDGIILIDIDDSTRFLKKPLGQINSDVWNMTSEVDAHGMTDFEYTVMPNAGYVNSANVNFRAYSVADLPTLFTDDFVVKPKGGHTIHIADSENNNWNVYELKPTDASIQYIEFEPESQSYKLYTNYSLFNYVDGNQIGTADTGRYLDYYLTLRNADVSDNVIVWNNERVVRFTELQIENYTAPRMIEARIASIGPGEDSTYDINYIAPHGAERYRGAVFTPANQPEGSSSCVITGIVNNRIQPGDAVRLVEKGVSYNLTTPVANCVVVDSGTANAEITFVDVTADMSGFAANTVVRVLPASSSISRQAVIRNITSNTITISGDFITNANTSITDANTAVNYFGLNVNLRNTVYQDLGDVPGDMVEDYFVVRQVYTESNGLTSVEINNGVGFTAFTGEEVSNSVINSFSVTDGRTVTVESANAIFSTDMAIRITGQTGATEPLNGLWKINKTTPNDITLSSNVYTASFSIQTPVSNGTYVFNNAVCRVPAYTVVDVIRANQTKITLTTDSALTTGDAIRVDANNWSGYYQISNMIDGKTFVIDAPYLLDSNETGKVYSQGIKIKTIGPHGISPEYADNGKKIAVHFAEPKTYNQIYRISRVTYDSIYISGVMPQTNGVIAYYDKIEGSASIGDGHIDNRKIYFGATTQLGRVIVFRKSDMSVVPTSNYQVLPDCVIINRNELSENVGESTYFVVVRDMVRAPYTYPTVTTVDHNKVKINGTEFSIKSTGSAESMVQNLNRDMDLKRAFIKPSGDLSKVTLSFPMVKDPNATVASPLGVDMPAFKINNYGPYVRDEESLRKILGVENTSDITTSTFQLTDGTEATVDPTFDQGPDRRGPYMGSLYYDSYVGETMVWQPATELGHRGKYVPIAPVYNENNRAFEMPDYYTPKPPRFHSDGAPILNIVPGTYPGGRNDSPNSPPGTRKSGYTMTDRISTVLPVYMDIDNLPSEVRVIDQANAIVSFPKYRLRANPENVYEVYEMMPYVESDVVTTDVTYNSTDGNIHIYGNAETVVTEGVTVTYTANTSLHGLIDEANSNITVTYNTEYTGQLQYVASLIDVSLPPQQSHDYYGTVDAYNDFYGFRVTRKALTEGTTYYSGAVTLAPVEPGSYIGKHIIPEPFAVRNSIYGNGTSSIKNFRAMEFTEVTPDGNSVKIMPQRQGQDQFTIWQPGLVPGARTPGDVVSLDEMPLLGKGSGYYSVNDQHQPQVYDGNAWVDYDGNIAGDYPTVNNTLYLDLIPRFAYSKKFKIDTATTNDDNVNLGGDYANSSSYLYTTTNVNDLDILPYYNVENTDFRPEEIFVAAFWTEPFVYKNQFVGYGPNPLQGGNPAPIYEDYAGTIVKFKYIRLTELPLDAVLQKPIADTGWGGKLDFMSGTPAETLDSPTATSTESNMYALTGADEMVYAGSLNTRAPEIIEQELGDAGTPGYLDEFINRNPDSAQLPAPANETSQQQSEGDFTFGGLGTPSTSALPREVAYTPPVMTKTPTPASAKVGMDVVALGRPNLNDAPVITIPDPILPGPCDVIDTAVPPGTTVGGDLGCGVDRTEIKSQMLTNNYYAGAGPGPIGGAWTRITTADPNNPADDEYLVPIYEYHSLGRLASDNAVIYLAADFSSNQLTAGGITVVQSKTPFGVTSSGARFDPRASESDSKLAAWWKNARVLRMLSTNRSESMSISETAIPGNTLTQTQQAAVDAAILDERIRIKRYGVDPLSSAVRRYSGRDNVANVATIGVSAQDGRDAAADFRSPAEFAIYQRQYWPCTDAIIGGPQRSTTVKDGIPLGRLATCNAVKGIIHMGENQIACGQGEYITVFVHIGRGSGLDGVDLESGQQAVTPDYQIYVDFNARDSLANGVDGDYVLAASDDPDNPGTSVTGGFDIKTWHTGAAPQGYGYTVDIGWYAYDDPTQNDTPGEGGSISITDLIVDDRYPASYASVVSNNHIYYFNPTISINDVRPYNIAIQYTGTDTVNNLTSTAQMRVHINEAVPENEPANGPGDPNPPPPEITTYPSYPYRDGAQVVWWRNTPDTLDIDRSQIRNTQMDTEKMPMYSGVPGFGASAFTDQGINNFTDFDRAWYPAYDATYRSIITDDTHPGLDKTKTFVRYENIYYPYHGPVIGTLFNPIIDEGAVTASISSYAYNASEFTVDQYGQPLDDVYSHVLRTRPFAFQTGSDTRINNAQRTTRSIEPFIKLNGLTVRKFVFSETGSSTLPAEQRQNIPDNSTGELKGYITVGEDGWYTIDTGSEAQIFVWISGVYYWYNEDSDTEIDSEAYNSLTDTEKTQYTKRWYGVDELGYIAGPNRSRNSSSLVGEYFKQDGWQGHWFDQNNTPIGYAADEPDGVQRKWIHTGETGTKQYHWDNVIAYRVPDTRHNYDDLPAPDAASVYLEAGRYYFVRSLVTVRGYPDNTSEFNKGAWVNISDSAGTSINMTFSGQSTETVPDDEVPTNNVTVCDTIFARDNTPRVYVFNAVADYALNLTAFNGDSIARFGQDDATVTVGGYNFTIQELATESWAGDENADKLAALRSKYHQQVANGKMETVEATIAATKVGVLIKWGSGGNYDYLWKAEPLLVNRCNGTFGTDGEAGAYYPPPNPDGVTKPASSGIEDVSEIELLDANCTPGANAGDPPANRITCDPNLGN